METSPRGADEPPTARPPVLGALLARPGRWFGFAAAIAASLYLARMVSIVVRETIGHGALAAGLGGRYDSYTISPWLQASAHWYGVHEDLQWVVRWGGAAAEAILGLVVLWVFRRKPRPLRTRSLALAALVVASLSGAVAYAIWGALVGTGDAADLYRLPAFERVAAVVALSVVLLLVVRWYVSNLLRWTEEQFVPADRRQRVACFLLAVALPVALLAGAVAYGGFPRYVNRDEVALAAALPLLLFAVYGAWRAARFLFPIGIHRLRRVVFGKGVAWLVVAAAASAAAAATSGRGVEVGLGRDRSPFGSRSSPIGLETFPASFPRTDLVPGLLGPPVEQEKVDLRLFADGPDGKPGFWRGNAGRFKRFDEDLVPHDDFQVSARFATVLPAGWLRPPDAEPLVLAANEHDDRVEIAAFRKGKTPVWTWNQPASLDASTVLHDARGPVGVALALDGDPSLVALDLEGNTLWKLSKWHLSNYDVRSHPALPGWLLVIRGHLLLLESAAGRALPRARLGIDSDAGGTLYRTSPFAYFSAGCLFPDAAGRPALVVANSHSPPDLRRLDASGLTVWKAKLPSDVEALEMIEPPGRPRLLVVTTEGGDLLVVGDDGTLYARERLPGAPTEDRTATYDLTAGQFREGSWGLAVELLSTEWVYRLHPEVLPAK